MPTVKLSPVFNEATLINGIPASGAKVFVYAAGSTTKQASYTDSTGTVAQANPIILNTRGEPASPIWLTAGLNYKFVLAASTDTDPPSSPIRTIDNISGINDASVSIDQWIPSGLTPTYISATQFSFPGDQTSTFTPGRRLKLTVTAGTVYGKITVSAYSSLTTITVLLDSGVLDSGLSAVAYGILSVTNPSVPDLYSSPIQQIGASVAANALTIASNAYGLSFRSATLSSGTPSFVSGTASSLTIPSGATLGTASGVSADLILLLMNNGGSLEYAIANASGGIDFSETNLISTTAISAAATSASVIYSNSARSNLPYRVLGLIRGSQATAGTWATTPDLQQGSGGMAELLSKINTTPPVTLTGTSVDFTGIPTWARRVTLMLRNASTNGSSLAIAQLGTVSSVETSSYLSTASTNGAQSTATTGFLTTYRGDASNALNGALVFNLLDPSTNLWVLNGSTSGAGASLDASVLAGGKALSGKLSRIRLTTVGGVDTYDAGSAIISWE